MAAFLGERNDMPSQAAPCRVVNGNRAERAEWMLLIPRLRKPRTLIITNIYTYCYNYETLYGDRRNR